MYRAKISQKINILHGYYPCIRDELHVCLLLLLLQYQASEVMVLLVEISPGGGFSITSAYITGVFIQTVVH